MIIKTKKYFGLLIGQHVLLLFLLPAVLRRLMGKLERPHQPKQPSHEFIVYCFTTQLCFQSASFPIYSFSHKSKTTSDQRKKFCQFNFFFVFSNTIHRNVSKNSVMETQPVGVGGLGGNTDTHIRVILGDVPSDGLSKQGQNRSNIKAVNHLQSRKCSRFLLLFLSEISDVFLSDTGVRTHPGTLDDAQTHGTFVCPKKRHEAIYPGLTQRL